MNRKAAIIAGILIITAIIFGAFGAHSLEKFLDPADLPKALDSFETGVRYQMYSGLALLILALNEQKFSFSVKAINSLILIGTLLFSFSIYLLSIQGPLHMSFKFLGPVTPIGGALIIIGWLLFLVRLFQTKD